MVEVKKLALMPILGINRNKIPGAQVIKSFNENSTTDSDLNSGDTFMASLFHYKPLKSVQHWQIKHLPSFRRNFREFLGNLLIIPRFLFGVLVLWLFRKCFYIFVACHHQSCGHLIFQTTNKPRSFSLVWKGGCPWLDQRGT